MSREKLPNRRQSQLVTYEHDGIEYVASISFYADGRPAEIFVDAKKPGSGVHAAQRAAAVAASLALQHGCPLDMLIAALPINPNGSPADPIAAALVAIMRTEDGTGPGAPATGAAVITRGAAPEAMRA